MLRKQHTLAVVAIALFLGAPATARADKASHEAQDELRYAYSLKDAHRYREAAEAFEKARLPGVNDQFISLELGYVFAAQGYIARAREYFIDATRGPDAEIGRRAVLEVDALAPNPTVTPEDALPEQPPAVATFIAAAAPPVADVGAIALDHAYKAKAAGNLVAAIGAFQRARVSGVDPQLVAMELGYIALTSGDTEEARAQFREAELGADKEVSDRAKKERVALPNHFHADIYADAYGWSRVDGPSNGNPVVPTVRLRGYYTPSFTVPFDFYLSAQATRDTSSHGYEGGALPQIYSDNYAMFGGGMRLRLWQNRIQVFGQASSAFNLIDDGRDHIALDLRGGAMMYAETSQCAPRANSGAGVWPCLEMYGEAIYVNRFDNDFIGVARPRAALGYLVSGPVVWQGVVEARAAKDVNNDYWNNFADAGAGHRWRLVEPLRVDFLLSANAGSYYGLSSRDPAPSHLSYVDLRALVSTYAEF